MAPCPISALDPSPAHERLEFRLAIKRSRYESAEISGTAACRHLPTAMLYNRFNKRVSPGRSRWYTRVEVGLWSRACRESAFDIHAPPDRWPMKLTRRTAGLIAFGLAVSIIAGTTAAPPDAQSKEKHWAFQPVRRPELPAVSDPAWSRNPIDRFVMAKMAAEGVQPVGEADRPTLDPAALSRPDRSAADARSGSGVRGGPVARCGREGG